jgi:hypothetical protein
MVGLLSTQKVAAAKTGMDNSVFRKEREREALRDIVGESTTRIKSPRNPKLQTKAAAPKLLTKPSSPGERYGLQSPNHVNKPAMAIAFTEDGDLVAEDSKPGEPKDSKAGAPPPGLPQKRGEDTTTGNQLQAVDMRDRHMIDLHFLAEALEARHTTILYLSGNAFRSLAPLAHFVNVQKVDLSANGMVTLPKAQDGVWDKLVQLRVLYLHNNSLTDWREFMGLDQCPRLEILSAFGNPVSNHRNYRHFLVNHVSTLMCLDRFVVTDEEHVQDADFSRHNYGTICGYIIYRYVYMHICVCVCVYVYIIYPSSALPYICMHMYIYIYIYIYKYTHYICMPFPTYVCRCMHIYI